MKVSGQFATCQIRIKDDSRLSLSIRELRFIATFPWTIRDFPLNITPKTIAYQFQIFNSLHFMMHMI